MSTEFDRKTFQNKGNNHKNYIEHFFEHFRSKLLDTQKSLFDDIILEITKQLI